MLEQMEKLILVFLFLFICCRSYCQVNNTDIIISEEQYFPFFIDSSFGSVFTKGASVFKKFDIANEWNFKVPNCSADSCHKSNISAFIQIPKDSCLFGFIVKELDLFFCDAIFDLDIYYTGMRIENNVIMNNRIDKYSGPVGDFWGMEQYYKNKAENIFINEERKSSNPIVLGCAIYRCWQNSNVVSYYVCRDGGDLNLPENYVVTYDRYTGKEITSFFDYLNITEEEQFLQFSTILLDLINSIKMDYEGYSENSKEHFTPLSLQEVLLLKWKHYAITSEGLSFSIGSFPFSNMSSETNIITLPFSRIAKFLKPKYLPDGVTLKTMFEQTEE